MLTRLKFPSSAPDHLYLELQRTHGGSIMTLGLRLWERMPNEIEL